MPLSLSGSYRLGDERTNISEGIREGEGIFFYLYREQKILEKLFHIVAIRNDLTTIDVKILYYLCQPHEKCTKKDMAGVLSISRRQLSGSIQRLLTKELILEQEKQKDKEKKEQRKSSRKTGRMKM